MANKVIIIGGTPPPAGGIASWTIRMMKAKLKNNWTVRIVDKKLVGKREIFGDKIKRNYMDEVQRCLRIWGDLRNCLREKDAKVVHDCIPSYTLSMMREYICACITKLYRRKYIIHFRCTVPNTTKGKLGNFILKRLCNISDCIMVLNQQSFDYVKKITKTPIEVIPNFIDDNLIVDYKDINETIRTALYVGGVIEEKGCIDIVDVAKEFPQIQFRLVGMPENKVLEYAKDTPNVIFAGPKNKEEVREEMKEADVFMFLSYFRGEGFSNALVEAMASGLPCIVSDWAANKDMIENQGGIVVPIKTPKSAVSALNTMMKSDIRRMQSTYNIRKVKEQYSEAIVVDEYVDCYERVIK